MHPRLRPCSARPPSSHNVAHDPSRVLHDIERHPAIYYPRILHHRKRTEQMRQRQSDIRRGEEITTLHPLYIQASTIWNHFCCVILFATKWGLNFHGLYHIVPCCTRLQSGASGRGQSERESTYIYLVCGLMAPYVCEEKWQAEVGSERRPTTPPLSHCAPHLPYLRHVPNTSLPCMNAVPPHWGCSVHLNTLCWVKASLLPWTSLILQPFLDPCLTKMWL